MLFQAKFNGHSLLHISQSSHVPHTPATAVCFIWPSLVQISKNSPVCTLALFRKKPDRPTREMQTLAVATQVSYR